MDCGIFKKDFGQKSKYSEEIIVFYDAESSKNGHDIKLGNRVCTRTRDAQRGNSLHCSALHGRKFNPNPKFLGTA